MKNKIFISVVLAVILAATMSVGCFAAETSSYLNTSGNIYSNNLNLNIASVTRYYSYSPISFNMTCTLSVQSKAIMGISSRSNIQLNVRKLNLSFYDAIVIYGANNLDQYLLTVAPSLSYTSIYTYNGNDTTSVDSDTSSLAMTGNSLYYYQNVFNSSYKSSEVGQLDYSIVFGTETLSNTHIYY